MSKPTPARKGRPPLPPEQTAHISYNVRLTPAQLLKVRALGGAAWIRAMIENARSEK